MAWHLIVTDKSSPQGQVLQVHDERRGMWDSAFGLWMRMLVARLDRTGHKHFSHPLKGTKVLVTFQSFSYLLASLILERYNRIWSFWGHCGFSLTMNFKDPWSRAGKFGNGGGLLTELTGACWVRAVTNQGWWGTWVQFDHGPHSIIFSFLFGIMYFPLDS